jgi:hypothetical protein
VEFFLRYHLSETGIASEEKSSNANTFEVLPGNEYELLKGKSTHENNGYEVFSE